MTPALEEQEFVGGFSSAVDEGGLELKAKAREILKMRVIKIHRFG